MSPYDDGRLSFEATPPRERSRSAQVIGRALGVMVLAALAALVLSGVSVLVILMWRAVL